MQLDKSMLLIQIYKWILLIRYFLIKFSFLKI